MATKNTEYKNTLIIQPGAIGDCVITLALVDMLHRQSGSGQIDIMGHTDYLSYFKTCTAIDNVLCMESARLHRLFDPQALEPKNDNQDSYDLAGQNNCDDLVRLFSRYDLIISFLNDDKDIFQQNVIRLAVRSGMVEVATIKLEPPADYRGHTSKYIIEQFLAELPFTEMQYPEVFAEPLIKIKKQHNIKAAEILEAIANPVIICPGSGSLNKCWPLENYIALAEKMVEQNLHPLFILGPAELERFAAAAIAELKEKFITLTDMSLSDIVAILDKAKIFIGNDSGITHIAGAMHIDTIAIFGPTDPALWQPLGHNTIICRQEQGWVGVDEVMEQIEIILDKKESI